MNIEVIFICIVLINEAMMKNQITSDECNIDTVIKNLGDAKFKEEFKKATGTGLLNIFKLEYGPVMPTMLKKDLQQICYCASVKIYSYTGEKEKISTESNYGYCRVPFYLSFQSYFTLSNATIKCTIKTTKQEFYLTETDRFYPAKYTHDLFVLELSDEDYRKGVWAGDNKQCIYYPYGTFVAIIPRIDFRKLK